MPPSALYVAFTKAFCSRVTVVTPIKIPTALLAKINRLTKKQAGEWWFARKYDGEHSVSLGHAIFLKALDKTDFELTMRWFLTGEEPPPFMGDPDALTQVIRNTFGEREVNILASFVFDATRYVSVFKPFDVGEPSQIFDEIIGFTGMKRDPQGKLLYRMEIEVTPKTIEHKLSFRQTVKLSDDMVIPVLETGSKISALAVKAKES